MGWLDWLGWVGCVVNEVGWSMVEGVEMVDLLLAVVLSQGAHLGDVVDVVVVVWR